MGNPSDYRCSLVSKSFQPRSRHPLVHFYFLYSVPIWNELSLTISGYRSEDYCLQVCNPVWNVWSLLIFRRYILPLSRMKNGVIMFLLGVYELLPGHTAPRTRRYGGKNIKYNTWINPFSKSSVFMALENSQTSQPNIFFLSFPGHLDPVQTLTVSLSPVYFIFERLMVIKLAFFSKILPVF